MSRIHGRRSFEEWHRKAKIKLWLEQATHGPIPSNIPISEKVRIQMHRDRRVAKWNQIIKNLELMIALES